MSKNIEEMFNRMNDVQLLNYAIFQQSTNRDTTKIVAYLASSHKFNLLVKAGGDYDKTVIHYIKTAPLAWLKRLIENGNLNVDAQIGHNKNTLLMELSSFFVIEAPTEATEKATYLLDMGADPKIKNRWNETPLSVPAFASFYKSYCMHKKLQKELAEKPAKKAKKLKI